MARHCALIAHLPLPLPLPLFLLLLLLLLPLPLCIGPTVVEAALPRPEQRQRQPDQPPGTNLDNDTLQTPCTTSHVIVSLPQNLTQAAFAPRLARLRASGFTQLRPLYHLRLVTACRPKRAGETVGVHDPATGSATTGIAGDVDARSGAKSDGDVYGLGDPTMSVLPDTDVRTASVSWALDRVDQPTLPLDGYAFSPRACAPNLAARAHFFVIDSGCDLSHAEFDLDRVLARPAKGSAFRSGSDANGHGTMVASLLAGRTVGVAPRARVTCLRVLRADGGGAFADVASALDEAAGAEGSPVLAVLALAGAPGRAADLAVARAAQQGVVAFAAAGNGGRDACDVSPARAERAVAVAALDRRDRLAAFSNAGPCVAAAAPGRRVRVAKRGGGYDVASGTSFAAPLAAGVVALRWPLGITRGEATTTAMQMLGRGVRAGGYAVPTLDGRCHGQFVGQESDSGDEVGGVIATAGGAAALAVVAASLLSWVSATRSSKRTMT